MGNKQGTPEQEGELVGEVGEVGTEDTNEPIADDAAEHVPSVEKSTFATQIADVMATEGGRDALKALFETLDKDGDGDVDSNEWGEAVFENKDIIFGGMSPYTKQDIDGAFAALDTNQDGVLSWDEFVGATAFFEGNSNHNDVDLTPNPLYDGTDGEPPEGRAIDPETGETVFAEMPDTYVAEDDEGEDSNVKKEHRPSYWEAKEEDHKHINKRGIAQAPDYVPQKVAFHPSEVVHKKQVTGKQAQAVQGSLANAEKKAAAKPALQTKQKRKLSVKVKAVKADVTESKYSLEEAKKERTIVVDSEGTQNVLSKLASVVAGNEKKSKVQGAKETARKPAEAILEKKALLEIGNNEGTEYDVGDIIGITSEHSAAVKAQMKGVAENQVADIDLMKDKIKSAATDNKDGSSISTKKYSNAEVLGNQLPKVKLDTKQMIKRNKEMNKEQKEYDEFFAKRLTQAKEIRETRKNYEEAQQAQVELAAKMEVERQQTKEAEEQRIMMEDLQLKETQKKEETERLLEERMAKARMHQEAQSNADTHATPWLRGAHQ